MPAIPPTTLRTPTAATRTAGAEEAVAEGTEMEAAEDMAVGAGAAVVVDMVVAEEAVVAMAEVETVTGEAEDMEVAAAVVDMEAAAVVNMEEAVAAAGDMAEAVEEAVEVTEGAAEDLLIRFPLKTRSLFKVCLLMSTKKILANFLGLLASSRWIERPTSRAFLSTPTETLVSPKVKLRSLMTIQALHRAPLDGSMARSSMGIR